MRNSQLKSGGIELKKVMAVQCACGNPLYSRTRSGGFYLRWEVVETGSKRKPHNGSWVLQSKPPGLFSLYPTPSFLL